MKARPALTYLRQAHAGSWLLTGLLLGLAVRYWHLARQKPESYQPAGVALSVEVKP